MEDKIYCIHCKSKNNKTDKYCSKCHRKLNPIDSVYITFISDEVKDKISGNIEDSIFTFIISFIKSHLYGTIVTFLVVGFVAGGIINNRLNAPHNIVNYTPYDDAIINNSGYYSDKEISSGKIDNSSIHIQDITDIYTFDEEYTDPDKLIQNLVLSVVFKNYTTNVKDTMEKFQNNIKYTNHYKDLTEKDIDSGIRLSDDSDKYDGPTIIDRYVSDLESAYSLVYENSTNIKPVSYKNDSSYIKMLSAEEREPDFGSKNEVFKNFEEFRMYLVVFSPFEFKNLDTNEKIYHKEFEPYYVRIVKRDGKWYYLYSTNSSYEYNGEVPVFTYLDREEVIFYTIEEAETDTRKAWVKEFDNFIARFRPIG